MVAQNPIDRARIEALGPAERVISALTTFQDHMVHNRPGIVVPDGRTKIGVRWEQVTWKQENDDKVVYRVQKVGKKQTLTRLGVLDVDGKTVRNGAQVVGQYRVPSDYPVFPEVATYLYRQVAEVYKLDQELAARWASWQFQRDHKDMKVVLAAFMLVQERAGAPVVENGEVLFNDEDYRAVGEAMCLLTTKDYIDAKLLLRIGDVLRLPAVAEINRELGFGKSARKSPMGRYHKAVTKWLQYRETNPQMLKGLVNKGQRQMVMALAQMVNYKPVSPAFFEILRWKQKQAKDGRRQMAIGVEVAKAETWEDLDEKGICQRIVESKPGWKRIVGLLPAKIGLTRAIAAAAIEAGSVSDNDIVILSPTLEELGLLNVPAIRQRWMIANENATNQRAKNIARNLKAKENVDVMNDSADLAAAKAMAEVVKDLLIMVIVDKSGSMDGAIERAREICKKLLVSFPMDRVRVSVFNTIGSEITLKAAKAAAIEHAFQGHRAGGATAYSEGVRCLAKYKPQPSQDVLPIFVGDQGDDYPTKLVQAIQETGWNPVAFGMLTVLGKHGWRGHVVEDAARMLQIPCINIEPELFDDPYTVTRTLRNLIATTPVGQKTGVVIPQRKTLVEEILQTPLLERPLWAA